MNLFSSWDSLLRILTSGILSYVALIIMLRVSGSRTLTQMNSFDFIVTIAMGSTLSSGLLQKSVSVADTVLALGLLIILQYMITKFSVKSKTANKLAKAEPKLLFVNGDFLESSMETERITKDEILASMRSQGIGSIDSVEAVILETNGKLSTIKKSDSSDHGVKTYHDTSNYKRGIYGTEYQH